MYKFPMSFQIEAQTPAGSNTTWSTQALSQTDALTCAIPPEFNGPGGGYSPEDFYGLALANCFIATFKVFAQNSKLDYRELAVKSELLVDRNDKGHPWMAKMNFKIQLSGVENTALAERVIDKTKMGCLVLNSVNTEKSFEVKLNP